MPYYYWWDPTYFLVIIGAVICLLASAIRLKNMQDTAVCPE